MNHKDLKIGMRSLFFICYMLLVGAIVSCQTKESKNTEKLNKLPNIVIIYLDDLGYGDVGLERAM